MKRIATTPKVRPLAPFLRGEGWGEGLPQQQDSWRVPLTRRALRVGLSPRAGRGEDIPLHAMAGPLHRPPHIALYESGSGESEGFANSAFNSFEIGVFRFNPFGGIFAMNHLSYNFWPSPDV
jgi:hypothetical protein